MKIKELTLGDVLKKEASQKTRKWIKSSNNSEICGQSFVVDNELDGFFICLSNPENGRILISPLIVNRGSGATPHGGSRGEAP